MKTIISTIIWNISILTEFYLEQIVRLQVKHTESKNHFLRRSKLKNVLFLRTLTYFNTFLTIEKILLLRSLFNHFFYKKKV